MSAQNSSKIKKTQKNLGINLPSKKIKPNGETNSNMLNDDRASIFISAIDLTPLSTISQDLNLSQDDISSKEDKNSAHHKVAYKPQNYKTVPCRLFHSLVGCTRGESCHFIHDLQFSGRETPNMHKYVRPLHLLSKNTKGPSSYQSGHSPGEETNSPSDSAQNQVNQPPPLPIMNIRSNPAGNINPSSNMVQNSLSNIPQNQSAYKSLMGVSNFNHQQINMQPPPNNSIIGNRPYHLNPTSNNMNNITNYPQNNMMHQSSRMINPQPPRMIPNNNPPGMGMGTMLFNDKQKSMMNYIPPPIPQGQYIGNGMNYPGNQSMVHMNRMMMSRPQMPNMMGNINFPNNYGRGKGIINEQDRKD